MPRVTRIRAPPTSTTTSPTAVPADRIRTGTNRGTFAPERASAAGRDVFSAPSCEAKGGSDDDDDIF
jgi:hypothetical protein